MTSTIAFEAGTIVVVEAKDFFQGKRIAVVTKMCKDHENGIECQLIDPEDPIPRICVNPFKKGDSIAKI